MIDIEQFGISQALFQDLESYVREVNEFRLHGALDRVAVAKLEEHFKASHVYHSAGIEGNRLTLQETVVVLREGIDVSDTPLKDTMEVANLGKAFDFLKMLVDSEQSLRETDIRDLHRIIVGDDKNAVPGAYRKTGVIIAGAEHRPPEPLAIPGLMEELFGWIKANSDTNPVLLAALAHHKVTAIHPFLDGNGRTARLLMNLILMRAGLPVSNVRREDRPKYYEALAFADVGLCEDLVRLVYIRSAELFREYERIREETRRMAEWAAQWGDKEAQVLLRRQSRELQLWQSRIRQVFLEFQKAAEYLDDELEHFRVEFFDYQNEITLDKFEQLRREGSAERSNAFAISFQHKPSGKYERFTFRYFRDWRHFPLRSSAIPLELHYLTPETGRYTSIGDSRYAELVRLRHLYFTDEGEFVLRYWNLSSRNEVEERGKTIQECVKWFFDDVLAHVFGIH